MIGRIVRPADFQRVLAIPPCSRSAHFAVHHLAGRPSLARADRQTSLSAVLVPALSPELSTGLLTTAARLVDELAVSPHSASSASHWLGLVVPKRHAKRAVTRNLIKRQIRAAMALHAPALPAGLWVVRLKQPFDRREFLSPASVPLRDSAHREIAMLFGRVGIDAPGPRRVG
jgi:ribonuclease P protein component